MNRGIKRVGLVLGTLALAAILLVPVFRSNAAELTSPRYTDNVAAASTPGVTTPSGGSYAPRNFWDYMYGMMSWMMGPYGNYQGDGGQSYRGNYPYNGMMGGY